MPRSATCSQPRLRGCCVEASGHALSPCWRAQPRSPCGCSCSSGGDPQCIPGGRFPHTPAPVRRRRQVGRYGAGVALITSPTTRLPAVIGVLGLKPLCRRWPPHALVVQSPAPEIAVQRGSGEQARRRPHQAARGLDPVLDQQLDGAAGGEVPVLQVRGAQLHRRDQLAEPLHLLLWQLAWAPTIAPMQRPRAELLAQRSINRGDRHAVEVGAALQQALPLGRSRRQVRQSPRSVTSVSSEGRRRRMSGAGFGEVVVERRFRDPHHPADLADRVTDAYGAARVNGGRSPRASARVRAAR